MCCADHHAVGVASEDHPWRVLASTEGSQAGPAASSGACTALAPHRALYLVYPQLGHRAVRRAQESRCGHSPGQCAFCMALGKL